MSRVWFAQALETVATYWRLDRSDGVTLGFTSHDADLWFDGVLHLASPGMMPAAIRRSAGFDADSAEINGALSHDAIDAFDLRSGRFDGARVAVGLVDWETLDHQPVYTGTIGTLGEEDGGFVAQLLSRKAELQRDPTPRTSPTCRADFCGAGCALSGVRFTHEAVLIEHDLAGNMVQVSGGITSDLLLGGTLRWMDGPYAGATMGILAAQDGMLMLDRPLDVALDSGLRVTLREGCDHTLATCANRFANAVNFQGEPFLPGNDALIRYGSSA